MLSTTEVRICSSVRQANNGRTKKTIGFDCHCWSHNRSYQPTAWNGEMRTKLRFSPRELLIMQACIHRFQLFKCRHNASFFGRGGSDTSQSSRNAWEISTCNWRSWPVLARRIWWLQFVSRIAKSTGCSGPGDVWRYWLGVVDESKNFQNHKSKDSTWGWSHQNCPTHVHFVQITIMCDLPYHTAICTPTKW